MHKFINKVSRLVFIGTKHLIWLFPKFQNIQQERIFVAGMQRSGTNMLMDILEKSMETVVYHERDPHAFDNYQMRGQQDIRALVEHSRAPKFVIKALCELQDLNKLMVSFQPAKTIWIVRDYDNVVASMLNSFNNMEKQVIRIIKDGSDEWLGRGMTNQVRKDLIAYVKPGMGEASASAMQWYIRNLLFFNQKFEQDQRVLLVSYEALASQPETQVQKICEFIGIEYRPCMVKGIFASSINRKKQPDIDPKIRMLCDTLQLEFQKLV